jgi:cell division protein FtsW (lipid II flippase)
MAVRNIIKNIWKWNSKEWRRNAAIMKTRGFWLVQVLWFVAGGFFFRLLPGRAPDQTWTHYILSIALIFAIVLPIYFSELLTWSKAINWIIERSRKQKP